MTTLVPVVVFVPMHRQPREAIAVREGKGKAIPLQAWTGPEGFKWLRLPDYERFGT
jgi:hypothetical protein